MKYKIQAIQTSDLQMLCCHMFGEIRPDSRSNFERSKYEFQFYQLWLNLVRFGYVGLG